MGGGMSKILPGLYVGNFRDAKDPVQLQNNNITHILSIHDNAKKLLDDKEYLIIIASDSPYEDLTRFFPQCIEFIHQARLSGGGVLVHCLAGVSRSVTVTAAYLMTVTNLNWRDAINAIRGARNHANPNFGFQKQLQSYETSLLKQAREQFKEKYPENKFNDRADLQQLLQAFNHYVLTGESTANSKACPNPKADGLYPLPPNAYSSKRNSTLNPDSAASTSSKNQSESESESPAAVSDSASAETQEEKSGSAEDQTADSSQAQSALADPEGTPEATPEPDAVK